MFEITEQTSLPVAKARAGDFGAWDALLTQFRMPLYVYIFQWVREEEMAFDLVQETMLAAVKHIHSLDDDSRFAAWLFQIAHQKCIQLWRKQKRHDEMLVEMTEVPVEFEEDPRQVLIRREREARFLQLLEELPALHRSVLVLFYVDEFSLEEIAAITETPMGTVKSRLFHARKAFKTLWESQTV